jgi:hypothetical protein
VRDAATDRQLALLGLQRAGQDAKERALADAVGADDADLVPGEIRNETFENSRSPPGCA